MPQIKPFAARNFATFAKISEPTALVGTIAQVLTDFFGASPFGDK